MTVSPKQSIDRKLSGLLQLSGFAMTTIIKYLNQQIKKITVQAIINKLTN
jgi:hypothetical protein